MVKNIPTYTGKRMTFFRIDAANRDALDLFPSVDWHAVVNEAIRSKLKTLRMPVAEIQAANRPLDPVRETKPAKRRNTSARRSDPSQDEIAERCREVRAAAGR